jgi:hypothetical protein
MAARAFLFRSSDMANEKSMARLAYETVRMLDARARRVQKKRDIVDGNVEPGHPRKKKGVPKSEKPAEERRHEPGEAGEVDRTSLAEEIEGTGGFRPGFLGQGPPGNAERSPSLSPGVATRISDIDQVRTAAEKRERKRRRER